MYESEANGRVEPVTQIPIEARARVTELVARIRRRTLLPWAEHCTECAMPGCYATCDLYTARDDGKCRRFEDGMVRLELDESASAYLLKIRFKRWGKLWAPTGLEMLPPDEARRRETVDRVLGTAIRLVPLRALRTRLGSSRAHRKGVAAERRTDGGGEPDAFVLECYHPGHAPIDLAITMRPLAPDRAHLFYQTRVALDPDFNRLRIELASIRDRLDVRAPFGVEILPDDDPDGTTLYFGLMDFVEDGQSVSIVPAPVPAPRPIEAVPSANVAVTSNAAHAGGVA